MYTFDRETKSIISPTGESLKGKAVTDRLNGLHAALMQVADIWSGLHIVMAAMDELFIGSGEDGDTIGEHDASVEGESSGAGDDV